MFGLGKIIQIPSEFQIGTNNAGKYTIVFQENNGIHLNKDAPNSFMVKSSDSSIVSISSPPAATTTKLGGSKSIEIQLNGLKESTTTPITITIDCRLYICSDKGMCSMKNESFELKVVVVSSSSNQEATNTYKHNLTME